MKDRILVIVESPYSGDFVRNNIYLSRCIKDCIDQEEVPFASHGFYTRYLDENNPDDRELGINMGYKIMEKADVVAIYMDYGMSNGMIKALEEASRLGKHIQLRYIGENE